MSPEAQSRARWIGGLLIVALLARVFFAHSKGLVLDEFHTLFHASRDGLGAVFSGLRRDNHPPLAILMVRFSRAILGDGALALRLPAIACGMLELWLVASMARRWLGTRAVCAVALVAVSSLHLDFSTQVRMYALLSLSVTGLLQTLLSALEERGRYWRIAGWIVLGVHAHYYFFIYGGILVALTLGLIWGQEQGRQRIRDLLPSLGLGIALCLPWLIWGFTEQLGHGLSPGGKDSGWRGLAEAMLHLLTLNVRLGGGGLREVFIACSGLALTMGMIGALALIGAGEHRARGIVLATAAFGIPLVASLIATAVPRAGFTWHYVLPSLPPLALLIAQAAEAGPIRRLTSCAILLGALTLSILNLSGPGTEDFPGAVGWILDEYQEGDLVVSTEYQPSLFPLGMPWDYYASRLSDDPPEREDMDGTHMLHPERLGSTRRVFVLASRLPKGHGLIVLLEQEFALTEHVNFGFGREVYLYTRQD